MSWAANVRVLDVSSIYAQCCFNCLWISLRSSTQVDLTISKLIIFSLKYYLQQLHQLFFSNFPGVVNNGMQVDSVFLKVPSRAIPGSLKAVLSLTGAKIHDDGSTSYCILASCRPRASFLLLIPAHSISILVSVISIGMITVGRGYIVNLKSMSFQPVMAFRKKNLLVVLFPDNIQSKNFLWL